MTLDYQSHLLTHVSAECEAGDFQAAADALNAYNVLAWNDKRWTTEDIITLVGPADALTVRNTMEEVAKVNALVKDACQTIPNPGLFLGNEFRQQMVDAVADAVIGTPLEWSAELRAAIKGAGVIAKNRLGGTAASPITCTAAEVEASYNKGFLEAWWETEQAKPDGIAVALQEGDSTKLKAALEAAAAGL